MDAGYTFIRDLRFKIKFSQGYIKIRTPKTYKGCGREVGKLDVSLGKKLT